MNGLYQDKEWLYKKYWEERLSRPKIAKLCNVSNNTILYYMRKYNIPHRSHKEAAISWNKGLTKETDKRIKQHSISQMGENNPRWKGGKTKLKNGYVMVRLSRNNPFISMANGRDNGVTEHRLIMAQKLGRCLESWEAVHHINHIRDDNRIENLTIIDGRKHFGFHHQITLLLKRIKELEKENSIIKRENKILKKIY